MMKLKAFDWFLEIKVSVKLAPPPKYYEIIGGYTGEVIGFCDSSALEDVKAEEPRASFRQISKEAYYAAMSDDWGAP